jgi:hypothetical protein
MTLPTSPAESKAKAGIKLYVMIKTIAWLAIPWAIAALAAWLYLTTV